MYEPLFTVVTPTSNIVDSDQADDFTLLVSMLARQSYPYIEHLVIDNASTDGTEILLKEYKNSGYLNFFSEPDLGKFDAMNKGILRSKGKYIAFLSVDDFYHDVVAIEDIVNLMEESNADFCFMPTYCRNPEDMKVRAFPPAIYNVFQLQPFPRQAMVLKKDTLERMGSFDAKFKMLADYDLMIRLILNERSGVYFNRIALTYPIAQQVKTFTVQADAEKRHIFHKNYRSLHPMSDDVIDRIITLGEIPIPLLEKLVKKFPEEDKELFYERYEQMAQYLKDLSEALEEQARLEYRERQREQRMRESEVEDDGFEDVEEE